MTTTKTSELRLRPGSGRGVRRQHRNRSGGERLTLELKLSGVWEGLLTTGAAECPVCAGPMSRAGSGGLCAGCGTALT